VAEAPLEELEGVGAGLQGGEGDLHQALGVGLVAGILHQGLEGVGQAAHGPGDGQGDAVHPGRAVGDHLHREQGLGVVGLGERVRQRGAGVPHVVQHLLAPVQVAQGGVVEPGEQFRLHLGGGAHQHPLGIGRRAAPREAVGRHHLRGRAILVGADALQGQGQGLGLGAHGALAVGLAAVQVTGPQEGDQPHLHTLAGGAAQFHRALQGLGPAPGVDAASFQGVGGVGDAGGGIVVAGDDQQGQARAGRAKVPQEFAPQPHGALGGQAAVEQVPGDEQGVVASGAAAFHHLAQDQALVVQEGVVEQDPAQVPVGGVEDAHGGPWSGGRPGGKARIAIRDDHGPFRPAPCPLCWMLEFPAAGIGAST